MTHYSIKLLDESQDFLEKIYSSLILCVILIIMGP